MISVKSNFSGDLRRFTLAEPVGIGELNSKITSIYRLTTLPVIKYKDDEGDFITLSTDVELVEALRLTPSLLRVEVGTSLTTDVGATSARTGSAEANMLPRDFYQHLVQGVVQALMSRQDDNSAAGWAWGRRGWGGMGRRGGRGGPLGWLMGAEGESVRNALNVVKNSVLDNNDGIKMWKVRKQLKLIVLRSFENTNDWVRPLPEDQISSLCQSVTDAMGENDISAETTNAVAELLKVALAEPRIRKKLLKMKTKMGRRASMRCPSFLRDPCSCGPGVAEAQQFPPYGDISGGQGPF